jgi:uncharacterized membrane protein YphA (DoxX/SURF4 family)
MHAFWAVKDPMAAQMQMVMFMKNVSIMGGALLLSYFGSGPLSLDGLLRARSVPRAAVAPRPASILRTGMSR